MNHVSCCFDQFVSHCSSMKRFFHVDCKSAVAQFEFKVVQGRCCLMIERLAGDTSLSIPQVNLLTSNDLNSCRNLAINLREESFALSTYPLQLHRAHLDFPPSLFAWFPLIQLLEQHKPDRCQGDIHTQLHSLQHLSVSAYFVVCSYQI